MVSSDPKSRTGAEDKKALLQMCVVSMSLSFVYELTDFVRIHAHGGSYVQFARDDPNLLVVYGGQTTRSSSESVPCRKYVAKRLDLAYDLKLVMNKDVCDVIRPQWILDCAAQEEVIPLTKKCLFPLGHTSHR